MSNSTSSVGPQPYDIIKKGASSSSPSHSSAVADTVAGGGDSHGLDYAPPPKRAACTSPLHTYLYRSACLYHVWIYHPPNRLTYYYWCRWYPCEEELPLSGKVPQDPADLSPSMSEVPHFM